MKYVRFCYSPFLCHLAEHCLACIFFLNSASKFYLLLENSILLVMLILTAPAKKETKLFNLHNVYTLSVNKKLQKYSYLVTNLLKGQKVSNHFNKENTLSILAESWRGEHTLPMCCTSPWYTVTHISKSDIHKSITKIRLFTRTDFIGTTNKHAFS